MPDNAETYGSVNTRPAAADCAEEGDSAAHGTADAAPERLEGALDQSALERADSTSVRRRQRSPSRSIRKATAKGRPEARSEWWRTATLMIAQMLMMLIPRMLMIVGMLMMSIPRLLIILRMVVLSVLLLMVVLNSILQELFGFADMAVLPCR